MADYDLSEEEIKRKYGFEHEYVRIALNPTNWLSYGQPDVCYESERTGRRFLVYVTVWNDKKYTGKPPTRAELKAIFTIAGGTWPDYRRAVPLTGQVYADWTAWEDERKYVRLPYHTTDYSGHPLVFRGALTSEEIYDLEHKIEAATELPPHPDQEPLLQSWQAFLVAINRSVSGASLSRSFF